MEKKKVNLKEARLERGLTLEGLARAADIPFSSLQAIESGRTKGTFMAKYKIADVLGIAFKELWPETYAEIAERMAQVGGLKGTKGRAK